MRDLKKTIAEECVSINQRIKKNSISVSLSQTNDMEMSLPEEMSIEEALRQILLHKNKK